MPTAPLLGVAMLATMLIAPTAALAGPWVHDAGDGYLKLGFSHYAASTSDTGDSTLRYQSETFNLYAEFGLPAEMQLVLDLPFVMATNRDSTGDNRFRHSSLGAMRIELDRQLVTGRTMVAVGVEAQIPGYRQATDYDEVDGLSDSQFRALAQSFPSLGDGVVSVTPKVLVGRGLPRIQGWFTGETGPRVRFGQQPTWYSAVGVGSFVIQQRLALGIYTSLDIGTQAEDPDNAAQQLWYTSAYLMLAAGDFAITATGGLTPWSRNASSGFDVGLAASTTF